MGHRQDSTPALLCDAVTKEFRRGRGLRRRVTRALDAASLRIEQGELFGLLGPNGAGKTTLVRCIATLLIPDSGTISVFGHDAFRESLVCRQRTGLLTSGERTLYWKLSARQNLNFFAALYGLTGKARDRRIDYLVELMGLKDVERERLERYSSGMKQKVALCRAILHDPDLVLLDEPTLGLDPQFSRFIRSFIKEELSRRQRKTILLTTHYMEEADTLCDRIAFISRGRIVDVRTPEEYKDNLPFERVLEVKCQGQPQIQAVERLAGVKSVRSESRDGMTTLRIVAPDSEAVLADVLEALRPGCRVLGIDVKEPTLEDVFIHVTGTSLAGGTAES